MKVKLISYTPNPDKLCAVAAYTSWGGCTDKLINDDEKAKDVLRRVISLGHLSVVEHANFTFSIQGISRACSHQLVRHRIASYTQLSQRYAKVRDGEYITPDSIKKNEEARRIYDELMDTITKTYKKFINLGAPLEDARYILPNATTTNIMVTMNARSLLHFFELRLCNRAQWEIRELAEKMLGEVKKVAPVLFENAGPRCKVLGYCPEGPLSCGLMPTREEIERRSKR